MSDKIDAVTLNSQRKCLFINSKSKMIQMEYKKNILAPMLQWKHAHNKNKTNGL